MNLQSVESGADNLSNNTDQIRTELDNVSDHFISGTVTMHEDAKVESWKFQQRLACIAACISSEGQCENIFPHKKCCLVCNL
jgi:hypothetical protein